MLTFCSLLLLFSTLLTDETGTTASTPAVPSRTLPADAPVIVLTGFEPFGEKRPANPSWEGISALHDTAWNGHRIVAIQLPVVWEIGRASCRERG